MAQQLRKPSGARGEKTGLMMNKANAYLYDITWNLMHPAAGESILEIGFGNGLSLQPKLAAHPGIFLTGLDFSDTMVRAATNNNKTAIESGALTIVQGSSNKMPFADNSFDKVYCINVLYFWDEPLPHLQEIYRVLKPGGKFFATIRSKESMKLMPFTKYGFTSYDEADWKKLISQTLFINPQAIEQHEPEVEFNGLKIQMRSLCLLAEK